MAQGWPCWMENWFMGYAVLMRLYQCCHQQKCSERSQLRAAPSHACTQQGGTTPAEPAGTLFSWEARFPKGEKHGRETCWWARLFSFLVHWNCLGTLNNFFFSWFPKRSTKYILPFLFKSDLKVSVSSAWGKWRHSYSVPINLSFSLRFGLCGFF